MTIKQQLLEQFESAIEMTFGSEQDEEYDITKVSLEDINEIARKVKWYLDL